MVTGQQHVVLFLLTISTMAGTMVHSTEAPECHDKNGCQECLDSTDDDCYWQTWVNCLSRIGNETHPVCEQHSITSHCKSSNSILFPSTNSHDYKPSANNTLTCELSERDLLCQMAYTCTDCLAIGSSHEDKTFCVWQGSVCCTEECHAKANRPPRKDVECQPCEIWTGNCLACLDSGCTFDYTTNECLSLRREESSRDFHLHPTYNNTPTCLKAARIAACMELTDCETCKSKVFDDTEKSCTWKSGAGNPYGTCCTDDCTVELHAFPKSCAACSEFHSCESCLGGGCRWNWRLGCVDDCSQSTEDKECKARDSAWNGTAFVPKSTKAICDELREHACEKQTNCDTCTGYQFLGDENTDECLWVWGLDSCSPSVNKYDSWDSWTASRACNPGLFTTCKTCLEAGFLWETQTNPPSCRSECSSFACYKMTAGNPVSLTCEKAALTAMCASQTNCRSCLDTVKPGNTSITCVWSGSSPSSGTCCTDECRQSYDAFPMQISTCNYCDLALDCVSCLDNQDMECLWWNSECVFEGLWEPGIEYCFSGVSGSSDNCLGYEQSLSDSNLCESQNDCESCTSTALSDGGTCDWYPSLSTCCTGVRCCNDFFLYDSSGYTQCAREECDTINTCEGCLDAIPTAYQPFVCKWSNGTCGNECTEGAVHCYNSPPWRNNTLELCTEARAASSESPATTNVAHPTQLTLTYPTPSSTTQDPTDRPTRLNTESSSTSVAHIGGSDHPTQLTSTYPTPSSTTQDSTDRPTRLDTESSSATSAHLHDYFCSTMLIIVAAGMLP